MELTRGRGPFPTVMVRVELPSDMKHEREMAIRRQHPLENYFGHAL